MKINNLMKKLMTFILICLLAFTAGCSSTDKNASDSSQQIASIPKKGSTADEGAQLTCSLSINCSSILDNMDKLDPAKKDFVPSDGWILEKTTVTFEKGESVHDILKRVCQSEGIHMESSYTPVYESAYVEGINQLYEFDCGNESGWMYKVNANFPNYGCSRYEVSEGDEIEWMYTCNLGTDVGNNSIK